jgi:exodeoxyribonuclease-1
MTDSIYWHDFETTGIDPVWDRAIQFAGVRTDLDLNEIAEPQNFIGLPANDIIPNPEALLVTGIMMSEIAKTGLVETEFTRQVLAQFSQANTCVAGFNNLRFDDEFTRQMLYRNFRDPYEREWRNGNSRWDVIDLFRAAYALRPDGFEWPTKEDGTPSFRLEDLARANGLAHLDAHDALADVRATIEVTRLLKKAQPKLFEFMFALREKKTVLAQLYPLGKQPIVHVSSMYPASDGCTALVLPLCQHPSNNNAVICFNLSQSPEVLQGVDPIELERLIFSRATDLGSNEERIALKTIQINRSPFVAPMGTLGEAQALRLGIDLPQCHAHAQSLIGSPGLVEKIQEAFSRQRFKDAEDPDAQLYQGGFFSESDRSLMREIVETDPSKIRAFQGRFQDDRLDEMLFRFQARNYPELLDSEEMNRWRSFRLSKWEQSGEPAKTKQQIEQLLVGCDEHSRQVLQDLNSYIDNLAVSE